MIRVYYRKGKELKKKQINVIKIYDYYHMQINKNLLNFKKNL